MSGPFGICFINLVTRLARFFLRFVPTFLINFSFRFRRFCQVVKAIYPLQRMLVRDLWRANGDVHANQNGDTATSVSGAHFAVGARAPRLQLNPSSRTFVACVNLCLPSFSFSCCSQLWHLISIMRASRLPLPLSCLLFSLLQHPKRNSFSRSAFS